VQFLIDACLPRSFTAILSEYGHEAIDVRDVGMRRADDPDIAHRARAELRTLLTEDWGFGDIRVSPPGEYQGIVVFETSDNSIDEKTAALRHLLDRADIVSALPGRLAIVTTRKIRLRPPI
jgi:predicted nuclease of predicted toxin-antitoxin system